METQIAAFLQAAAAHFARSLDVPFDFVRASNVGATSPLHACKRSLVDKVERGAAIL